MSQSPPDKTVIEPEVLPPEKGDRGRRASLPPPGVKGTFVLILVGLLLDALDMLTMGLVGLRIGLLAGFATAFILFSLVRIPFRRRLIYSLAAGVYCLIPGTEMLPLGTLLAIFLGLRRE